MKLKSKIILALLLFCLACSNVKETPKGLAYTVIKKGDGIVGKPGQFLVLSILLKDAKDSVYFNNQTMDFPEPIRVPDTTNIKGDEGVSEIFRYLSKGDSVKLKIKAQDLYTKNMKQPLPPKMDAKSEFTFTFGVTNIISEADFIKMRTEMGAKQKEKFMKQQTVQLGRDTVTIDSLLSAKKLTASRTTSGLRYAITKKTNGPPVVRGKTISLEYAGYLVNGKYFDTNIEAVGKANALTRPSYAPWELPAGQGRVIPGLDESLLLMHKGETMTVYIPSTLAYGPQKVNENIGPNSILIFDVQVLDVKDPAQPKK